MSTRLQILVPEEIGRRVRKTAQRNRVSTSAWVRGIIEQALADDRAGGDALDRLAQLSAPTGDVGDMLSEIEVGRGR
jgi:cytochrome P450